jgi:thiamine kinase-like enzyme
LSGFHQQDFYIEKAKIISGRISDKNLKELLSKVIKEISVKQSIFFENIQLIHGDPRVENILFNDKLASFAFIDYDTFMRGSIYVDIGDCIRSLLYTYQNKKNTNALKQFINGYRLGNIKCSAIKYDKVKKATLYMTLELCLRFLIDTVDDCYFHWDKKKYKSRKEHNKVRATEIWNFYNKLKKSL